MVRPIVNKRTKKVMEYHLVQQLWIDGKIITSEDVQTYHDIYEAVQACARSIISMNSEDKDAS